MLKNNRIVIIAGLAQSLLNFRGPLIRELIDRSCDVICIAPQDEAVAEKIESFGAGFIALDLERARTGLFSDLQYVWTLRCLLRRVCPTLVLAYTVKPVIYGLVAAQVAGVRRRFALITGLGYAFGRERFQQRILRIVVSALYYVALRKVEAVIFQNPDDHEEFVGRGIVRSESCKVVRGSGIDTVQFRCTRMPEAPVFLLVARLLADKGIREYVAAARIVKRRYPKAEFKIAGSFDPNPMGLSSAEVEGWRKEGVIDYVGTLRDVRSAYDACRFYVLPSYYREGTPRTVLEAMSIGRPIITTDAPGCRETVVNGFNGFLVPVKDPEALAQAMLRLLDNPTLAERMGQASRKIAEEKYDVQRVNACMCEILGIPKRDESGANAQSDFGRRAV